MAGSLPAENLQPQNVGSIINYLQQCTEEAQWELLVAVYHNELRTMASETVDLIDWSHPPPAWAVPPELTYCTVLTRPTNRKTCCTNRDSNTRPLVCHTNALPVRPLAQGVYDYSTYMTTPRMDIRYTYISYTYGYSKDGCTFYLHMLYLWLLLGWLYVIPTNIIHIWQLLGWLYVIPTNVMHIWLLLGWLYDIPTNVIHTVYGYS